MIAGKLRQRVTFQRATETADSFNQPIPAWSAITTVWARVEPIGGMEKYAAMHTQSGVDYKVTVRYQSALASLAPDDLIVWGSVTMDIKNIINAEGRNIQLEVFAKSHT